MEHLDEAALEASAGGRDELLPEAAREHLRGCESCRERVAAERELSRDASVALRRAMPQIEGLDAMIARAMEHAPAAERALAPSRRSLWVGAVAGLLAAAALAVLSLPSLHGLGALGRQGLTLVRAADSVVGSVVPGGWPVVALVGLALALLLAVPARLLLGERRGGGLVTGALALVFAVVAGAASPARAYRVEGAWPQPSPRVTVDVDERPTSEALRLAAEAAGLGLVARLPADPPVTLHVRDVPIADVVQALLGDADVVVVPGEALLTVRPDVAPAVQAPPPPRVPSVPEVPAPPARASAVGDRVTFGADVVVEPHETVRAVYTMGGDARVLGRAFGDVVTMGGDADVVGEVIGNVTTMGGDITVREGARVHGDLNAMGGRIDVDDGAMVHGQALSASSAAPSRALSLRRVAHDEGDAGESGFFRWGLWHALLFLLGLVLLGTSGERFAVLRRELGARPVQSAFGGLFGLLAGGILCVVLVLTVIGIPGSVVLGALLFVGLWIGWTTTAYWLGGVLPIGALKERPVLQLAAGVALLFAVGLVPKIGPILSIAAVLAGLGAVIATRFGTKPRAPKRTHVATGPFRSAR